jgi:hypothetical protein
LAVKEEKKVDGKKCGNVEIWPLKKRKKWMGKNVEVARRNR